jgi:hypothetical protein
LATQGRAAGGIAYGANKISAGQVESAEKTQGPADLPPRAEYRVSMKRVKLDREKAGFKPKPIISQ